MLNRLVEEALKANLSLALAEASLRQARALRGVAAAGLWPSATASAADQRQAGPLYGTNGYPRNSYLATVDAAWELDFFGGVRRNVESAGANVRAAVENLRDVQVILIAEVALDYIQLRGYQQQIVTARNNLKAQEHTADITRRLYKVGFDSGLDVQFSFTGGANWQTSTANTWFKGMSRSLFIGPAATWPIFQGGAIVSNIHAQEALRDQAFVTYQQTLLTALQDVENALVAFAKEQQHHKSLTDAVAADRKAVDLSLRLYQEGQTDFLSVLIAERQQYTDENALTTSTQNIAADLIALYKALGGGWEVG
jgi:outer membrane protein TolC